ncbi:UDP-N-acetylmuramoyl-L-alanyl-D-glutamate--2,6-diaminopimelate ligase [Candidatus Norongarragalina meridionalis]|nr:UDP-N-acetylmuramoyl-L-alanyl-D-glutamate--2,6-diaminopimelate ligase [Candidatus Norongarragalina meridionalis]
MDYATAVRWLGKLPTPKQWTLERMRILCAAAGVVPPKNVVHITGTNGKGSVAALIAASLPEKVGLYTSPHLVAVRERIRINGNDVGEKVFAKAVSEIADATKKMREKPSYFEVLTAVAFKIFQDEKVDWAVLEVGLGGRLDATNVADARVAVITNVGLEHTELLGKTVQEIAHEKSGIIKSGCVVVTACDGRALREIDTKARREHARIIALGKQFEIANVKVKEDGTSFEVLTRGGRIPLKTRLIGSFQARNAALAAVVLRELGFEWPMIRNGLLKARWEGRMDLRDGVLLDGSHNYDGAVAMREALAELWPGARYAIVFGVMKDKNWRAMIATLAPIADVFVATQPKLERSLGANIIAKEAKNYCGNVFAVRDVRAAIEFAKKKSKGKKVVACGSLFLIGEALSARVELEEKR